MSQVEVKDERHGLRGPKVMFYQLDSGEIFSPVGAPDSIWVKAGDERALEIVGERPGVFQNAGTKASCFRRRDLRLTLLLENK